MSLLDDRETCAPLILFEYDHDPGRYCLTLSDNHMVEVCEPFEDAGWLGNGYDWEAVARQAVRASAPMLDGRFDYDSEAGAFVAFGRDLEALRQLGELLRQAFHDQDRLAALVEGADPDWFD